MSGTAAAWPTDLKITDQGRVLRVTFESGTAFPLPAEYLRVFSPSAEVKGHSRRERKIVGGKRDVAIIGVDPVGSYAVKLTFDDMHATGIYTWDYLHELGRDRDEKWATYLRELNERGLSREKAGESAAGDH